MTPFMLSVQGLLDGEATPEPATEPARPEKVAAAADTQVLVRSLAEQLVSEANAVLGPSREPLTLVDETGPGALAFTVGRADRTARVQTVVSGRTATAELIIGGRPTGASRRLAGEDEVQALLLSLIAHS
ncbi:hypothetical protein [Amycolatopsis orientalis]|uniref:hypothetical protein n=1 Tax=Amycolatopsis orientalis TaxID=31958 RepID=UPI0003A86591|nr:hypothetical protein [Amycolatopsis orientalis]